MYRHQHETENDQYKSVFVVPQYVQGQIQGLGKIRSVAQNGTQDPGLLDPPSMFHVEKNAAPFFDVIHTGRVACSEKHALHLCATRREQLKCYKQLEQQKSMNVTWIRTGG